MLFSVLIVNYNSGGYLARCLEGLAAQSWRDFETVLVDNASCDDSLARAAAWLDGVTLVRAPGNLGFAAGNNLAARHARGAWLVALNPDAVAEPDWLDQLARAIARHPGAVAFGCTQLSLDDPGRLDGSGDAYHVSGLAWRGGFGHDAAAIPADYRVFAPCAAAAAYRRDAFDAAAGFDESYFCYFEDVDLGFRLRLAGGEIVQLAQARVRHAGSAISGRRSAFSVFHGTRNRIWTFFKDMPLPLLLLFLPLHLAMNAVMLARALPQGTFGPTLRGILAGFAGLPALWRRRGTVQAARRAPLTALLAVMAVSPASFLRRAPVVRPLPPERVG